MTQNCVQLIQRLHTDINNDGKTACIVFNQSVCVCARFNSIFVSGTLFVVVVKTQDGIGFGVTHSMVTMMFESSLQAVNPKLSLPYWDYTIEASVIENEYDGDYTKLREASDLWTSEWFGSVDNADFQV